MKENSYYNEIKNVIETLESNNELRSRKNNNDKLKAYWEIGNILVTISNEKEFTKKSAIQFEELYGKNYSYTNLMRFKQFYLEFKNFAAVRSQLT